MCVSLCACIRSTLYSIYYVTHPSEWKRFTFLRPMINDHDHDHHIIIIIVTVILIKSTHNNEQPVYIYLCRREVQLNQWAFYSSSIRFHILILHTPTTLISFLNAWMHMFTLILFWGFSSFIWHLFHSCNGIVFFFSSFSNSWASENQLFSEKKNISNDK